MFLPSDGLVVDLNPVVDTGIYASGDVLFAPTKMQNVALNTKGRSLLRDVLVIDGDNQKAAMDLLFFDRDPGSIAAVNAAVTLSDTQLSYLIGKVSVLSADYATLQANTNAVAAVSPEKILQTMQGSKDVWVAAVSRGTPTYTAATKLRVKFLVERQQ